MGKSNWAPFLTSFRFRPYSAPKKKLYQKPIPFFFVSSVLAENFFFRYFRVFFCALAYVGLLCSKSIEMFIHFL